MSGYRSTINVAAALGATVDGVEDGATLAVEHLLTEANKSVPHDEGTLERSGETGVERTDSGVRGSVSYDTKYAVRQHEDMSLNHDGKGEAKWLESTFGRERSTVSQIIATAIRRRLQ